MPQLQINQGPQDALLYDNSRSYFTNVGYVRTSNFQMELRDVDPQNSAKEGATVQFVIPKAADLLGPVDLLLETEAHTTTGSGDTGGAGDSQTLVDKFGYACIDKITFAVGSHDIEEITGEQLNLVNELMRDDESRQFKTIGHSTSMSTASEHSFIVPLGLFFTKHPSQYFPLAAIAGCNDVRIQIRFKPLAQLIQHNYDTGPAFANGLLKSGACKLRCHYIHVTGPEATTLMNKEHVRLLKVFQHSSQVMKQNSTSTNIDLSFLHPVSELLITIRKMDDITSSVSTLNYFDYKDIGTKFKLTLNGQERHPGLTGGIDKAYLMDRLLPMLHSNSKSTYGDIAGSTFDPLAKLFDRSAIYVYPFCLNPEGSNPSGAVNMSKVSHAKLTVEHTGTSGVDYQLDVYAINYNWLQIKDGRALTSFA